MNLSKIHKGIGYSVVVSAMLLTTGGVARAESMVDVDCANLTTGPGSADSCVVNIDASEVEKIIHKASVHDAIVEKSDTGDITIAFTTTAGGPGGITTGSISSMHDRVALVTGGLGLGFVGAGDSSFSGTGVNSVTGPSSANSVEMNVDQSFHGYYKSSASAWLSSRQKLYTGDIDIQSVTTAGGNIGTGDIEVSNNEVVVVGEDSHGSLAHWGVGSRTASFTGINELTGPSSANAATLNLDQSQSIYHSVRNSANSTSYLHAATGDVTIANTTSAGGGISTGGVSSSSTRIIEVH